MGDARMHSIDDLLKDMHHDRMMVAREQLQSLEVQILKRRLASIEISATFLSQIEELTQQILSLQPEGGMPDLRRRDREPLERERRQLQGALQNENQQKLRDLERLEQEKRQVNREAMEEEQRYERINTILYNERTE